MGLLELLFGRTPKKQESKPKPVRKAPGMSAVFIDIPNIVNAKFSPDETHRLLPGWEEVLQKDIQHNTARSHIALRFAASSMEVENLAQGEVLTKVSKRWTDAGYEYENNPIKDIDSILGIRLVGCVSRQMEKYPDRIVYFHLILVGGDHIYTRAIQELRSTFPERLKLFVTIYSWKRSLSSEYWKVADRKVRFLHQIPGLSRKIERVHQRKEPKKRQSHRRLA